MTLPGLYLGLLISTGLGLTFHFIRGGGLARLALYLVTAWVAFSVGQLVADLLNWHLFRVGPLNLFAAVLAAIVGLMTASLLAGPERRRRVAGRDRKSGQSG
jgi:branched-subunit amino acid ABC-type transport system permease component